MTVTVRFAPSPTGYLHIGNLRPALFNWLFAQERGGRFVLRFDDTDTARSKESYATAIEEDLAWIGIRPDLVVRQSDRLALYDAAADRLRAAGLLYPCFEAAGDLERRRKRALAAGQPPIYGRDALRLSKAEIDALLAEGRQPHWRFRLPNTVAGSLDPVRTEITWNDRVRGPQAVDIGSFSDPVLVREDGSYLYTLPSVVDDGVMEVSDVLRGDDHLTNTAVQIAIADALGYEQAKYAHINLLTTIGGEGLSKRSGALSLRTLREAGYEPMSLASLAVLTGSAGEIVPAADLEALREHAALEATSASSAKFDPAELDRLNAAIVHAMPVDDAAAALRAFGVPQGELDAFWMAVRDNCVKVADAAEWSRIVYGEIPAFDGSEEDRAFLAAAEQVLPEGPFDSGTWAAWTASVKATTGRKGKALFQPLRKALTGLDHGPELAQLLPLIGRDRAAGRL